MSNNPMLHRLISGGLKKWVYKAARFNQYGLMRDDLYNDLFSADITEALRRLPPEIRDQRNFRIVRAMHLDACHKILPEEQWTKLEEDVKYLQPFLDEVIKERKEKEEWEAS